MEDFNHHYLDDIDVRLKFIHSWIILIINKIMIQVRIIHNTNICGYLAGVGMQMDTSSCYKHKVLKSTQAFLSMFVMARKSFTWNKIVWLHVCKLSFDPLKTGISLFIHLGVYAANWLRCVLVHWVATGATDMSTPMESVHKEMCVLKMSWLAV